MTYGLLVKHVHVIQSKRLVRFVRLVLWALVEIVLILQLESSQRTVVRRPPEVRTISSHFVLIVLLPSFRVHQQLVRFVDLQKFGLCLRVAVRVPIWFE